MAQTTPADSTVVEQKPKEHEAPVKPAVNEVEAAKQGAHSKLQADLGGKPLDKTPTPHHDDGAESHDLLRNSTPGHDGVIPPAAKVNDQARVIDNMSNSGGATRVRSENSGTVSVDGATMHVKGNDYRVGTDSDGKSQIYLVGKGENGQPEYLPVKKAGDVPKGYQPSEAAPERPRVSPPSEGDRRNDGEVQSRRAQADAPAVPAGADAATRRQESDASSGRRSADSGATAPNEPKVQTQDALRRTDDPQRGRLDATDLGGRDKPRRGDSTDDSHRTDTTLDAGGRRTQTTPPADASTKLASPDVAAKPADPVVKPSEPLVRTSDPVAKPAEPVVKPAIDVSTVGSRNAADTLQKPDRVNDGKTPDAKGTEVKPAQPNPGAQPVLPVSPAAPKDAVPKDVSGQVQRPEVVTPALPAPGQKLDGVTPSPRDVSGKDVSGQIQRPEVVTPALPAPGQKLDGVTPSPRDVSGKDVSGQIQRPEVVTPALPAPGQKLDGITPSIPKDVVPKDNPGLGQKPDASSFNRVGQLDSSNPNPNPNFPGRNPDGRNSDLTAKPIDTSLSKPDPGAAVAARIGDQMQPKDGMPRDSKSIDPGLAAAVNATRIAEGSLKPGDQGPKPPLDGKPGDGPTKVGDVLAGKTADAPLGRVGEIKLDPSQQMAQQLNKLDDATIAHFREMVANFRAQNLNQDPMGLGRAMLPGEMKSGFGLENKGANLDNRLAENKGMTPAQLTEAMRNLGINAEMLKAMEANKTLSVRDARLLEGLLKAEPVPVRALEATRPGGPGGLGGDMGLRDTMRTDLRAQEARLDAARAQPQRPVAENLPGGKPEMRLDGKEVARPEITFAPRLDQAGRIEPVTRPGLEPKAESRPEAPRPEMSIRQDTAAMNIEAQRQNSMAGKNMDDTTHSTVKDGQTAYDNHRPNSNTGLTPEDEKELLAKKLRDAEREKEEEDKAIANARNAMMAAMLANSKKQAEQAEKELQLRNDDAKKKGESQRRRYVVKEKDTLESIAKKQLRDVRLAALIYEINKHMLPVRMEKGKQVVDPRPGTSIWLPSEVDIREFRGRLYAGGKPSLPALGGGSKTKMTPEEELANRFGANWDSNAPTGGVQAGMMEAAVAQSAARRANIEKVLGPISNKAADGGRIRYIVRLSDTLETVAVKHPALKDAMLWPLLALINNLPVDIDSEGRPLATLKRGMMLDIPLPQEIEEFRQGSFFSGDQSQEFESAANVAGAVEEADEEAEGEETDGSESEDLDDFEDIDEVDDADEADYDDDATIVATPAAPAPFLSGASTAQLPLPNDRPTLPLGAQPSQSASNIPQLTPPTIQQPPQVPLPVAPPTVPLPVVPVVPVVPAAQVPPQNASPVVPQVPPPAPPQLQPPQVQAPQFQQVSSARNPVVSNPISARVQPGTETLPLNPVSPQNTGAAVPGQGGAPQPNQMQGNQNPPITSIDSGRDPYASNPLGRPPQVSGDRLMWSLDPSVRLVKSAYKWDPTIGVFRSQLELLYNGVWYPVIFFEVFAEAAVRHEYIGMGRRKSVRIDLPPTAAQELADNDLVNNWQAYCSRFVSYLMNPPPGGQ